MPKAPETAVIDEGLEITVNRHPAMERQVLQVELAKVLLPALAAAQSLGDVTSLAQADVGKLAGALKAVAEVLKPDDVPTLMLKVLRYTRAVYKDPESGNRISTPLGNKEAFNVVFDDREPWAVLAFVVKTNMPSVFRSVGLQPSTTPTP